MIADGIIGDVVKVDLHWSWYSPYRWAKKDQDLAKIKESDVDWNTWLMGKPHRPFDPRVFRCFRLWKDFSSGIIDQWMTHGIDLAHMLTGTSYPLSAVAHGGIYAWKDWRENADTIEVSLEYEKNGRKFLTVYSTNLINGYGKATQLHGTLGSFEAGGSNNREDWSKGRAESSANPNVPWHFSGRGVEAEGKIEDQVPFLTLRAKGATWPTGLTPFAPGTARGCTVPWRPDTVIPSPASCPPIPIGAAGA